MRAGRRVSSGLARALRGLAAAAVACALGCAPGSEPSPPGAPGWNLLLVTLDTLRADRLGCYGYGAAETPHLDGLAARGLRFEQAMTPAPLTLPAHATILTGLLPPRHGLRGNGTGSLPPDLGTMATRLAEGGYRTGAFVGSFVLDRRFGLGRGFAAYDDEVDRSGPRGAGLEAERPGREVVDRALAWLAAGDSRPFFAWVHLYDAHAPYEPPEPYASRHAGRAYDGEISEVDAQVGRLLAFLAEQGAAQRTVVAVAGDHGEALGEHGELTHGFFLYEPSLRVPLILAAPGVLPGGRVVVQPVGLADLAPTLLALLGQAPEGEPSRPLDGRDLAADLVAGREPPAADLYAETRYPASFGWSALTALRRGPLKYVAAPRPEVYDLAADPGESTNRLAERRREASEMARRLAELGRDEVLAEPAALDRDTRERLSALGYVAETAASPAASASGLADPKDRIELFRAFEEAHWAVEEGRIAEAAATLEGLLAADPGNPGFRGELARAVRERGDLPRAIELYRQALAAAPDDPEGWYNLATTLQEAARHAEALDALDQALRRDPDRPEALNALGIAYAATGRLAEAAEQLSRAVAVDPGNARAWNNLGNVRRDLGQSAAAEEAYRRAIELAPDYADPWNGLGTLLVSRDRPGAALPFFDRALALAPDLHEVRLNRAICLETAGDRPAAIAAYREFLSATRGDPALRDQRQAAQQLLARLVEGG